MVVRPVDRWLVDWDDDGTFQHAHSDVTQYVLSHRFGYGTLLTPDPFDIRFAPGGGRLTLYNKDDLFNPYGAYAGAGGQIPRPGLLGTRAVQLVTTIPATDTTDRRELVSWEGRMSAGTGRPLLEGGEAIFNLIGVNDYDVQVDYRRVDPGDEDQLAALVAQVAPDITTTPVTGWRVGSFGIGRHRWSGQLIVWLNTLANYLGGWAFENRRGQLEVVARHVLSGGQATPEAETAPLQGPPAALTNPTQTGMTATWYEPDDGNDPITSYDYQYGPDAESLINGSTPLRTIMLTSLSAGTRYQFRWRAVNSTGNGEWSEWAYRYTVATPIPPGQTVPPPKPSPPRITAESTYRFPFDARIRFTLPTSGGPFTTARLIWVEEAEPPFTERTETQYNIDINTLEVYLPYALYFTFEYSATWYISNSHGESAESDQTFFIP